jgi:CRISPR system Cascade subunit CasA
MGGLWHTCWLNVLTRPGLEELTGNPERRGQKDMFPWMASTRTSEGSGGVATTPDDASPLQVFWATPRRLRLDWSHRHEGECDLCGRSAELLTRYHTKSYGVNYTGPWRHPLSPHRVEKDGSVIPLHGQPGGIGYRHWLGLALGNEADSREAAAVVTAFHRRFKRDRSARMRLWVFGYDMDNMKARAWNESLMPIWRLDETTLRHLRGHVRDLLAAASEVAGNLRSCVVAAWFSPGATVRGDTSFLLQAFWQATENGFFSSLERLLEPETGETAILEIYRSWHTHLCRASEQLFDTWAEGSDTDSANLARVARARLNLRRFNRKKVIRDALRLDAGRHAPRSGSEISASPPGR